MRARSPRLGRLVASWLIVVATASAITVASPQHALAASYSNPAFFDETYLSGFSGPVQMEWLADGRLLVAEQNGTIRLVDGGVVQPTPFVDISGQVNGIRDRGLLGIAAHPAFPTQPYVYLLFTYDPPETVGQSGRAGPNGKGARASRLIRVTANPADGYSTALPGSELILMGTNSTAAAIGNLSAAMNDFSQTTCTDSGGAPVRDCLPADSESHTIGSVRFGGDGYLYVGNGDASSYTQVDSRALRALDVDSMAGKIFRIDPLTGQGIADNPFYDGDPGSNRSKVWQLGLRNPFRFTIDPNDGQPWIGDVGWGAWEEINHGSAGTDFGWPCYEGGSGSSSQQPGYAALSACATYYGSNAASPADYAWYRAGQGGAALAGVVYTGSLYPSEYQNAVFFGDYAQGFIRYSPTDGAGNLLTDAGGDPIVEEFATGVGPFVDIAQGPDDRLYYIDIISGSIKRITYFDSSAGPQVGYEYYEGTWTALPDFDSLTAEATGITDTFDPSVGARDDNFGIRFRTCLQVAESGDYTFRTRSDDGSQLLIDGILVVDNDGTHGPTTVSATATLSSGFYPIEVTYFDGTGGEELEVTWSGPSFGSRAIAPASATACDASISSSSDDVAFGDITVGASLARSVTLTNLSAAADIEITAATIADSEFTVQGDIPTVLGTGATTDFQITYTPTSLGPNSATLSVVHSGIDSPTEIALSGTGLAPPNNPPTIEILSPLDGQSFDIGTAVPLEAVGSDDEDGTAAVSWTGILHHGSDHVHPGEFNASGAVSSFILSDHDDNSWIEVCATATDSGDATATACIDVYPNLVDYTFASQPTGLTITYHGQAHTTPFTVATPVGADRSIAAPESQDGLEFTSWSVGGPASQTITIGTDPITLTAVYDDIHDDDPILTNPGNQANRVGDALELALVATDPDGGQVAITVDGLPPGLMYEPTTSIVAGTPTVVGQYTVTATATDDEGAQVTEQFDWTVAAALQIPGDIDGNLYYDDILWLVDNSITLGCNPPANDEFCPAKTVTRGQMAAFLVRFLGLTAIDGSIAFTDTATSVFEQDILKLATAGITTGCNADGTQFCPNKGVTRGQMAAFLVRALGLTNDGGGNLFGDDDTSVFETDIDKLATAEITLGCNPPTNSNFCPTKTVTRGHMAAFLHRAQALLDD